MRYARDRDRSMGVTKRALFLYVYYNQCACTHENGNVRTIRNGTRSKRPAHAGETARHENFNFLLIVTVQIVYVLNVRVYKHSMA